MSVALRLPFFWAEEPAPGEVVGSAMVLSIKVSDSDGGMMKVLLRKEGVAPSIGSSLIEL